MKVIEPGHVYELQHLESEGVERLTFIKRSSGAVDYGDQEVNTKLNFFRLVGTDM